MTFALDIAARTLWSEVRGETEDGQRAVAAVIVNRLEDGRWGQNLAAICLAPYQFSCWMPNDPNLRAIANLGDNDPLLLTLRGFIQAAQVGRADPTNGAMWYYAISMPNSPNWAAGAQFCGEFGSQRFFKGVK